MMIQKDLFENISLKAAPFLYLRHGQTEWNAQKRLMGQQDIPLNPVGIQQALQARELLRGQKIETICYSPLARAKQTAEIINEAFNCRMVCIDPLKEFYLGKFQGEVKEAWFDNWRAGHTEPDIESYSAFIHRAVQGINLALNFAPNLLIVAHGGVYWAIQHALKFENPLDLPNCIPMLHLPPADPAGAWKRTSL
jgi:broad specificity phosphatase PhoE